MTSLVDDIETLTLRLDHSFLRCCYFRDTSDSATNLRHIFGAIDDAIRLGERGTISCLFLVFPGDWITWHFYGEIKRCLWPPNLTDSFWSVCRSRVVIDVIY